MTDPGEIPSGAWDLPEELVMLRDTVRRFVETEVRPLEDKMGVDDVFLPPEDAAKLQEKARDLGLWALQTPKKYGGAGLGVLAQAIVHEEACRCKLGASNPAAGAFGGNPPNAMYSASPEQFENYARPIIEGKAPRAFNAISEPSGGSDPARAIQCRAVRDGKAYVFNGTKTWISHVGPSQWGIVYARTGETGRRDAISCFIVETDTPGLTMTPIPVITPASPHELSFKDARVPVENLVGSEGQGFSLASGFLVHGRVTYGAQCIGVASLALEMAIEWAKDREAFGSRLAEKQAIQWMVADSAVELEAARLMVYRAAWDFDLGRDARVSASMAKLYASEAAFRIVDRCIQIFGGLGVAKELPLERWFRELRLKRLGEGTSEIHRMVIARSLLGSR